MKSLQKYFDYIILLDYIGYDYITDYIGYVTIKKDLKVYSVNSLYLIFHKVNGYCKEINGNKHLTLVPTNKSKDKIKKI